MAIRIAINGYGRIGRNVLRAIFEMNRTSEFKVVAVNASGDLATNAHLTKFDTVHGRFNADVKADVEGGWLRVNDTNIKFFPPATRPSCRGAIWASTSCWNAPARLVSKAKCQAHLDAGAKSTDFGTGRQGCRCHRGLRRQPSPAAQRHDGGIERIVHHQLPGTGGQGVA